jgi:DNA-binding IclR family transcriptional regulator
MVGKRRADGQQSTMAAETTAEQWVVILNVMHRLTTTDPAPLTAALIAQHAHMEQSSVERHLRSMARVGLVHQARHGRRGEWLLDHEP